MIVNKETKKYQTRSDKPNSNWLDDENYLVVDDNSEISDKIKKYYPYLNLIIENNKIIDVVEDIAAKEHEFEKKNINNEIATLKELLANSDYQAIKYAEGQISEEEYQPIKEQRQVWRDRINELEASLEVQADG